MSPLRPQDSDRQPLPAARKKSRPTEIEKTLESNGDPVVVGRGGGRPASPGRTRGGREGEAAARAVEKHNVAARRQVNRGRRTRYT